MCFVSPVYRNRFRDFPRPLLAAPGTLFKNLQPFRESVLERVLGGNFCPAGLSEPLSQFRAFDECAKLLEPFPRIRGQEAVAVFFDNLAIRAHWRSYHRQTAGHVLDQFQPALAARKFGVRKRHDADVAFGEVLTLGGHGPLPTFNPQAIRGKIARADEAEDSMRMLLLQSL